MKYRIFLSTFVLVFLAELGDKTQIASFSLAANSGSGLAVFCGAALAFALSTAVAVLASGYAARVVSPTVMKFVSAGLFIGFGLWMLLA